MLRYRPEIDGLRALAVLSVILYHAGISGFSGGFVGVDVFFVISGYLITSILVDGFTRGTYSIGQFYERRIRRIFPPLFAMLAVSWGISAFVLLPSEMKDFAKSTLQATLFVSNIGFFLDSDYFARAAETKPLLHTWSLCVEEQFYVVFPVLASFVFRARRSALRWVVSLLCLGGFAASAYVVREDASQAFYLAHLRAWELMIGSLISLGAFREVRDATVRALLSTVGLSCVLYSVFSFNAGMSFPGPSALIPTLGTALIIHSENVGASWVSKVLSHKLAVSVGLISYALYLWHWPLLVLARIGNIEPLSGAKTALVLLLTVVLSVASRHLLEEPIRKAKLIATRRQVFVWAAAAMTATCVIASLGVSMRGFPSRMPKSALALSKVGRNPAAALHDICLPGTDVKHPSLRGIARCDLGDEKAPLSFLMWGDSHAQSLSPAVHQAAKSLGLRGTVITHGGCPPALGVRLAHRANKCAIFHEYVQDVLKSQPSYQTVILHARWGAWLEARHFTGSSPIRLVEGENIAADAERAEPMMLRGIERTLQFLKEQHRRVIVVGSVAEPGFHVPAELSRSVWLGRKIALHLDAKEDLLRQAPLRRILTELASRYEFSLVMPHDALCDESFCHATRNGRSLYFDSQHLIANAAPLLSPMLTEVMRQR